MVTIATLAAGWAVTLAKSDGRIDTHEVQIKRNTSDILDNKKDIDELKRMRDTLGRIDENVKFLKGQKNQ